MHESLINSQIFKGLQLDEIKILLDNLNFQIKDYKKESVIRLAQDDCNALMIIEEGIVRGEMTEMNGKVLKVEDITASNTIAAAFLFGKHHRFPVNVIANTDCKIIIIPKTEFVKLLQENETILVNYLNIISNKAQFLSSRLNILSLKDLKAKLSHYILSQTQNGRVINFTMSQNQTKLADFLGVARPSLARAFKQLVDDNIIELNRSDVRILDINRLRTGSNK